MSPSLSAWNRLRNRVNDSPEAREIVCRLYRFFDLLVAPAVLVTLFEPLFWLLGRRGHDPFDKKKVQRIIVFRTERIGDLVLSTPFFRELRKRFPEAHIALFLNPGVANILELDPNIDEIICFHEDGWKRGWNWKWRSHRFIFALPAALKLWSKRFDLAIKPGWNMDLHYTSSIAYLCGAKWRVGYSESMQAEKAVVNKGYDRFFTHIVKAPLNKHEVEHNLFILSAFEAEPELERNDVPPGDHIEIRLDERDEQFAEQFLADLAIERSQQCIPKGLSALPDNRVDRSKEGPRVAMCLGASLEYKKWPTERYEQVARWLVETYDAEIVMLGGVEDVESSQRLVEIDPSSIVSVAGKTTLRQSAALLKRCDLYLGNDTGPMHLAGAFAVPVVAVFSYPASAVKYEYNCPMRFRPWQTRAITLQPPIAQDNCAKNGFGVCTRPYAHCILQVTADDVKNAVARTLEGTRCGIARERTGVAARGEITF